MFRHLRALALLYLLVSSAATASADYALVTNAYSSRVSKLDTLTNSTLSTLRIADSIGFQIPNITNIVFDSVHNCAYVADHVAGAISIIDLATWTSKGPASIAGLGQQPIGMAINRACDRLYVLTRGADGIDDPTDPLELLSISGATSPPTLTKTSALSVGKHPISVILSHDEKYALATCRNQACFTVVRTDSMTISYVRNYPDSSYEPEGVDLHPVRNLAYVFSHGHNAIDIFDFDSMRVLSTVPISNPQPCSPSGGSFSPNGNLLLVSGQTVAKEFIFNTTDPYHPIQTPNTVAVGPQPHRPLFLTETRAYVPNTNNTHPVGSISIVSLAGTPSNISQVTGTFNGPLGMVLVTSPVSSSGCCVGTTGNVDGSPGDITDISDLFAFIDYLSSGAPLSSCPAENDVNRDGVLDISDLFTLADYLALIAPLPPCP